MPPYKRLMAASSLACLKEVKVRLGKPYFTSTSSIKEKLSPNKLLSIIAAAVEITLWPLVYSGKGGVCKMGVQLASMCSLITVSGRIN